MDEGTKGSITPTSTVAAAATKRTKFRRTGGSKNASSWSSSAGSSSATTTTHHHAALIASLLADLSSEVIFEDERQLHPGLPIRAASIRALVRLCVQSFSECPDQTNMRFPFRSAHVPQMSYIFPLVL